MQRRKVQNVVQQPAAAQQVTRWIVYKLTNTQTGKEYTGKTKQALADRLKGHRSKAAAAAKGCRLLYAAIAKDGWSSFEVTLLHDLRCTDEQADYLESEAIVKTLHPVGYNLRHGAMAGAAPAKRRLRWSDAETDALLRGVKKHGKGAWLTILRDGEFLFDMKRSAVDLKDKFRNLFI